MIFIEVSKYGNYEVSKTGLVRSKDRIIEYNNGKKSLHKGRVLRPLVKNGYHYTGISINGLVKHEPTHRLVAMAFMPNPDNKPQINHKNGNKTDNRVENLEWCTRSENAIHSLNILGHVHGMKGKFKRPQKICKCGKPFQPVRDSADYCSKSCATKFQKRFDKTKL